MLCLFPCPTDMVRLCSDTVARSRLNLAQAFTGPKKLRTSSGRSWRGARGPPPLFLDQAEARRAGNIFFEDSPAPPYLKVWIRH